MIYNFIDDFMQMKTTVYLYNEYTDKIGELKKLPLSKPLKKDYTFGDILCRFNLNWLFKNSKYGTNIKQITALARTYPHGTIEYNEIKEHMPGYTWNGNVKIIDDFDEENQVFFERRLKRANENIILSGTVAIEFDDIEENKVPDYIQEAFKKFPHLIYAGRTLSNKMFCIHRADNKLTIQNFTRYFYELAVQYYNEIGIRCDIQVNEPARCRFMCDQIGAKANLQYCDFHPSENVEVEYAKIFNNKENQGITRVNKYIPEKDETIYEYDNNKGFYYGHGKQHILKINDLIVPVPSITQIINTLLALKFGREDIVKLWDTKLNYYNYNTNSRDVSDCISLTRKFTIDTDEYIVGVNTYNFLCMFMPDIIGIKGFYLCKEEYLNDRFYDLIKNAIIKQKIILIYGDTGIGKTYIIKKLGEELNVIVIVPYIAHMDNYKSFEPIENINDIDEPIISGVVIWDRFVKLFNKGLIDDNAIIIIDESHKLFLDQSYREAAIKLNSIIPQLKNHICYMSATPVKEINVEQTYRFEKERNPIILKHFDIVPDEKTPIVNNIVLVQAYIHLIYGCIKYFDHIFIASNKCAQKIYDRLYGRFDCQLIRANQKDSLEYIELMKTQELKHKIIIGTCIAYEGLNFCNKNEKILTLTDIDEQTTVEKLIQIAGRVRYSKNTMYVLDLPSFIEDKDFNEWAKYYNTIEEIKSNYNQYNKHKLVQDYPDIQQEIQDWYNQYSKIEYIKENLPRYIQWKDFEIKASLLSNKSPLNIRVKEYIVEYLKEHDEMLQNVSIELKGIDDNTSIFFDNDNYINITEEGQSGMIIREKIHDEQYSYRKLLEYVDYNKINKMITESWTLPKGVNGDICRIIDIIKLSDIEYNKYVNELETYLKTLNGVYYHSLDREIKQIKKTRDKYYNCFDSDYDTMYNKVFDIYVIERKKIHDKKVDNGKIGKSCTITDKFKHPEKYNLTIGQVFSTSNELSAHTGKTKKTITEWRNKGWIE